MCPMTDVTIFWDESRFRSATVDFEALVAKMREMGVPERDIPDEPDDLIDRKPTYEPSAISALERMGVEIDDEPITECQVVKVSTGEPGDECEGAPDERDEFS